MNIVEIFSVIAQIGQSTNGGFYVIALIALAATWMLYRGARVQFTTLRDELQKCNQKHEDHDVQLAQLRKDHNAELDALYIRLRTITISAASMWTLISMSGDRREYKLPPLEEVLEGKMIIKLAANDPISSDRRAAGTPLVYAEKTG